MSRVVGGPIGSVRVSLGVCQGFIGSSSRVRWGFVGGTFGPERWLSQWSIVLLVNFLYYWAESLFPVTIKYTVDLN
jgi:hypothetical protein